jgi:hypothetical protein
VELADDISQQAVANPSGTREYRDDAYNKWWLLNRRLHILRWIERAEFDIEQWKRGDEFLIDDLGKVENLLIRMRANITSAQYELENIGKHLQDELPEQRVAFEKLHGILIREYRTLQPLVGSAKYHQESVESQQKTRIYNLR